MADLIARQSPVKSHDFVVRAAVVNVILPNNMAMASEEVGIPANIEDVSSIIPILVYCIRMMTSKNETVYKGD
jgi:hypothetical protein